MALYLGDCLEIMPTLPAASVDLILCDLPYGTTQNKWDSIIPLERLWAEYWRIAKPSAAIVLTAQCPFDKALGASQLGSLRYEWIWHKSHATGHLNANRAPMKEHENVLVFYRCAPAYNPQKELKPAANVRPSKRVATASSNYGSFDPNAARTDSENVSFPRSVLKFNSASTGPDKGLHPTQKPVALMEYFIRTYTNEGDTVLDNCMGSGTTGVAAGKTGRRFIGIEKDPHYFETAKNRLGVKQMWPWV